MGRRAAVVGHVGESGSSKLCDCSAESPAWRRSVCSDRKARDARNGNKPNGCALDRAVALVCDRRSGRVFVYHNGAESCYAARSFRAPLRV